jgi:hypothetical protein
MKSRELFFNAQAVLQLLDKKSPAVKQGFTAEPDYQR